MINGDTSQAALIHVTLNGDSATFPATFSIADIVRHLAVPGRYAVEVNGEILPRSRHAERRVIAGDRIEVVHAIGGG